MPDHERGQSHCNANLWTLDTFGEEGVFRCRREFLGWVCFASCATRLVCRCFVVRHKLWLAAYNFRMSSSKACNSRKRSKHVKVLLHLPFFDTSKNIDYCIYYTFLILLTQASCKTAVHVRGASFKIAWGKWGARRKLLSGASSTGQ